MFPSHDVRAEAEYLRAIANNDYSGKCWPLLGLLMLIAEFIREDSSFCSTRAITRTVIGPSCTPLSLIQRCAGLLVTSFFSL